jgi:hypothetical protein
MFRVVVIEKAMRVTRRHGGAALPDPQRQGTRNMKKIVGTALFASALMLGGFAGQARAESDMTPYYPRVASNNVVGGGPVQVINTGNSAMPTKSIAIGPSPVSAQPNAPALASSIRTGSQSSGG